jgi:hypothetical protein
MIGDRHPLIDKSFSKQLLMLCGGIKRRRHGATWERSYFYEIPTLEECRKQFDQTIMGSISWEPDPDP